jgi:phosphodiester glycosidase
VPSDASRRGLQLAITIIVAIGAFTTPAQATRYVHSFHDGRGLRLKTIKDTKGPEQIRVLTLRPGRSVPDIAPADPDFPMWADTSTMSESIGAIAGVNGDFGTSQGEPKHVLMIDGELWTSGLIGGNVIAWSTSGRTAFIGHPRLKIRARDLSRRSRFFVATWNAGPPRAGKIAGYTVRGGTVTQPPGHVNPSAGDAHWCAARLVPAHPIGWNSKARTALVRRYTVDAQPEPCPKTPLGLRSQKGNVVIAARASSRRSKKITRLKVNDTIKVAWTLRHWPRVTDVMGAQQMLVKDGTSMGISKGCSDTRRTTRCRMFVITVDGRQSTWSAGMRMPRLASEQIRAGAWRAVNLDGGGSTSMWNMKRSSRYCQYVVDVGGCVVDRPSGGDERATRSAVAILPTVDRGTPKQLR